MKVIRAPGGQKAPPCEAVVRIASGDTWTRRHREQLAARRGWSVDQCGRRSYYVIDGVAMCQAHAGQAALKHLLNPTEEPR